MQEKKIGTGWSGGGNRQHGGCTAFNGNGGIEFGVAWKSLDCLQLDGSAFPQRKGQAIGAGSAHRHAAREQADARPQGMARARLELEMHPPDAASARGYSPAIKRLIEGHQ